MRKSIFGIMFLIFFNILPSFSKESLKDYEKYTGSYVCWDAPYFPSHIPPNYGQPKKPNEKVDEKWPYEVDDFKDFPFLNIRTTKDGRLIGELWGSEKTENGNKKGYFRVIVSNLDIKSNGQISFEIGERALYSKPMGWNKKSGAKIGVSKSKKNYLGKITGKYFDNLDLICKGFDCFTGMQVYSKDHP